MGKKFQQMKSRLILTLPPTRFPNFALTMNESLIFETAVLDNTSHTEISIESVHHDNKLANFGEITTVESCQRLNELDEIAVEHDPFDCPFDEREFILWLTRENKIKYFACKNYSNIMWQIPHILDAEIYLRYVF